jgi:hypothetical protein
MSESFHAILNLIASVVLEDFKVTAPYFYDHLPLKRTWLFLYEIEFHSSKNDVYQFLLKLAGWFWRRFLYLNRFESSSPIYDLCHVWLKLSQ